MIVAIAEKEYSSRIDTVREEELCAKATVFGIDGGRIEYGVPAIVDVLHDRSKEGAGVEGIHHSQSARVCRIESPISDVEVLIRVIETDPQMAADLVGDIGLCVESLPCTDICIVNAIVPNRAEAESEASGGPHSA